MIRNENEYREAVARLAEERGRMKAQQAELKKMGLKANEVKRAIDPIRSFHLQLEEEVQSYERLKQGEFDELSDLRGVGHLLISLRIRRGLTPARVRSTARGSRIAGFP